MPANWQNTKKDHERLMDYVKENLRRVGIFKFRKT